MSKLNVAELGQQIRPLDPTVLPPDIEMEDIPDEYEGAPPPPQPQRFVLQLPADLSNCWEILECKVQDPAKPNDPSAQIPLSAFAGDDGKRVALRFDGTDVLQIVGQTAQKQAQRSYIGEPLYSRISFRERNRAKKNEPQVLVSDMIYLIKALYAAELEAGSVKLPRRGDNNAVVNLLVAAAGRRFSAEWEWSAYCNPKRQSQILINNELTDWVNPENGTQVMGCGTRMYNSSWPKDPTTWLYIERATCPNPKHGYAVLRPFGELRRFKPAA